MKVTINITKAERQHIIENGSCFYDSCSCVQKIGEKLKKSLKRKVK